MVYWYKNRKTDRPPLTTHENTDVVVVGGGMAGLSCAYVLAQAGVSVILIEREFCGAGASGKTSGFITPDSEIELSSLLRHHTPESARAIWDFVVSGVEQIRQTTQRHGITCDLQEQDSLFVAASSFAKRFPKEEHEARERVGFASTYYNRADLQTILGTDRYLAAVRYPKTFGIDAFTYCQALRDVLLSLGVRVHERTPAEFVEEGCVRTPQGSVRAPAIMVCTDRFLPELKIFQDKVYQAQTFLAMTKPLATADVRRLFPETPCMVWDTGIVYRYFRLTGENRLLIGGGHLSLAYKKHPSVHPERLAGFLLKYMHGRFPWLKLQMEDVWGGMLGVSKDLLPIAGPHPTVPGVFCVSAATGLPWAAALGTYAAQKYLNGRSEFDTVFSPERSFPIGAGVQRVLGKPLTFMLSHGIAKYL